MKKFILGSLAVLAMPALAMAQMGGPPATSPNAMVQPTITTEMSAQDRMFIEKAAASGLAEIQDGKLAETQGDAKVQQVAQMMVTDHTAANEKLKSLAAELGYPAPVKVTAKQAAMTASLQGLSGPAFDSAYLKGQEKAHEKAIALFQKESVSGDNLSLKQFAVQTLPVLQKHLAMIKAALGT